jgi:nitroreductase
MTPELDALEAVVRRRRTCLLMVREQEVPDALIARLCGLATWAPNHKRTWPWRFAHLTGEGRARLGEAFAADLLASGATDEARLAKTRTKYLRAPHVLLVGSAAHEEPEYHGENRDAVAAGIQNLLLGATAAGLASFWSSPPTRVAPTALALVGFEPDTQLVGVVYLGWPTGEASPPARPELVITRVA